MVVRGNCYYTTEALYHLLGGKKSGWFPMYMHTRATGNHWFLKHNSGMILDVTAKQFPKRVKIPYSKAVPKGFLTKAPSRAAKLLMNNLIWQVTEV